MMGIVGALGMLPDLFFGMVAGALADRGDRRRMMLLADLGRAGLTALIPLSVLLGGPTIAVILIVVAPLSILRALFIAGYSASVPMLVGRSDLGRALSIFEAIYSFGFIIGPAIAGFLAATIGPGPTLAIDAASFALSSLAIAFMRPLRPPADRPPASLVADIREGIDYIVGHAALRSIILFWGLVAITTAPLVTVLAVLVTRDHGYDAAVLGLVLTAFGVGTVVGALLTARAKRRPVAPSMLGGTAGIGALAIVVAVSDQVPVLLAAAGLAGHLPEPRVPDVHHGPDELRSGCPARAGRQYGADDLARSPADRDARGRPADRPHQRLDDDRAHGRRADRARAGVHAGRPAASRDDAARDAAVAVRRRRPARQPGPGRRRR